MIEENELEWELDGEDWPKRVIMRAMSTDSVFWFEIEPFFEGEDGDLGGYSLLAEGTLLSEHDTVPECRAKAQQIQNVIDGVN